MSPSTRRYDERDDVHQALAQRFPRVLRLANGGEVPLTPIVPSDWESLEQFVGQVPPAERVFFRRDNSDRQRVQRWCSQVDYQQLLPLLAWNGSQIIADGVLQRDVGLWMSRVGSVRLIVHPSYRRRGLGRALLEELIEVARILGIYKLVSECVTPQIELIALLKRCGFGEVVRLPSHVRDRNGLWHDMTLLSKNLES